MPFIRRTCRKGGHSNKSKEGDRIINSAPLQSAQCLVASKSNSFSYKGCHGSDVIHKGDVTKFSQRLDNGGVKISKE